MPEISASFGLDDLSGDDEELATAHGLDRERVRRAMSRVLLAEEGLGPMDLVPTPEDMIGAGIEPAAALDWILSVDLAVEAHDLGVWERITAATAPATPWDQLPQTIQAATRFLVDNAKSLQARGSGPEGNTWLERRVSRLYPGALVRFAEGAEGGAGEPTLAPADAALVSDVRAVTSDLLNVALREARRAVQDGNGRRLWPLVLAELPAQAHSDFLALVRRIERALGAVTPEPTDFDGLGGLSEVISLIAHFESECASASWSDVALELRKVEETVPLRNYYQLRLDHPSLHRSVIDTARDCLRRADAFQARRRAVLWADLTNEIESRTVALRAGLRAKVGERDTIATELGRWVLPGSAAAARKTAPRVREESTDAIVVTLVDGKYFRADGKRLEIQKDESPLRTRPFTRGSHPADWLVAIVTRQEPAPKVRRDTPARSQLQNAIRRATGDPSFEILKTSLGATRPLVFDAETRLKLGL